MYSSSEKDIFLFHAWEDKIVVEKLAINLQKSGAKVWLESWWEKNGDDISNKIQSGLKESRFLGIWLTNNLLNYGLFKKELQSKIFAEVIDDNTIVLLLLGETCEIPEFLKDKPHADFRGDYDKAFRTLLKILHLEPRTTGPKVLAFTKDILEDLSDVAIPLPYNGQIKILETLKRMPRSGKQVRLENFEFKIPIRSIYDHILSVAHSADCLVPTIKHGIKENEYGELARCIAYHEINEIFLGDIPSYTNLSKRGIKSTELFAEAQLRSVSKEKRERVTNEFISMFLEERERKSLRKVNEYLNGKPNPISKFMKVLDKIDPIITVWRYLHFFRGKLGANADSFLKRLKDFFDYPEVKLIAKEYDIDRRIYDLVATLQDRDLAKNYYNDRKVLQNSVGLFSLPTEVVVDIIEGREFNFIENKDRRKLKNVLE